VQFGKRGLACQPAIVGLGIGGSKDTCVRLGKEAACLRAVGSRNPDPAIAALEDELTALGNYIGIGAMGFAGTSLVVATHVEVAFSHTGGMPVGLHSFCLSSRRATARIHPGGRVEFRADPMWFTDYHRRGIRNDAGQPVWPPGGVGPRPDTMIERLDDAGCTKCADTPR
jgi:L(+)-tartrate dehydratase alpha subunit